MIDIKEAKSKKDLRDFIKFPFRVYKNDKNWVAPLISERKDFFNPKKNPFFKHAQVRFYLAQKDGVTVGRIAAIMNYNHIEFHNEKTGFFGFFECLEDFEIARQLLDTAQAWLKSQGMEIMQGPSNYSTNEEVGFLLEGFDTPPAFMMSYNPQYYLDFMKKYGMTKAKDIYAYYIDSEYKIPERMIKMAEKIKQRENLVVRSLNLKDFENEAKRIKEIYNSAWTKNWGFIPMTDEEFDHLAKNLKKIVDPDLLFLAFVNGEPAGFSLCLPNLNEALHKINGRLFPFGLFKLLWNAKRIKSARILTMGVKPEFRKRGIDNIFYIETFNVGVRKGYKWGEMSWVLEDNIQMNKILELLGAKLYKKYRIYEMKI